MIWCITLICICSASSPMTTTLYLYHLQLFSSANLNVLLLHTYIFFLKTKKDQNTFFLVVCYWRLLTWFFSVFLSGAHQAKLLYMRHWVAETKHFHTKMRPVVQYFISISALILVVFFTFIWEFKVRWLKTIIKNKQKTVAIRTSPICFCLLKRPFADSRVEYRYIF